MNFKTGTLLAISAIAVIAAVAFAFSVFFSGSDAERIDAEGTGAVFSEETTSSSEAETTEEFTEETSTEETEDETTEETATVTKTEERTEERTVEPDTPDIPAPMIQAGLRPANAVCDDTPVLIVESVLDDGSGNQAAQRIPEVMNIYPGTVFYTPGACPSLRASVDGQDVYAVAREYDDTAALCDAWAAQGGNARLLNGDTSYSSPC
ncbi:MAG: hypothetical protein SPJ78_00905 [Corynebacterium camporealensis]|uniref:hypothetical protein n=1 Tax=Corynebacterium camporealensis TaxID=161896 RepID=UPI002A91DB26|nr:hypothetical protein [Corynebacterium camporealensis]MDY5839270.1 hypothetical protein [Corynebacterium camporealensis]